MARHGATTAVITGGASGLGLAMAEELVARGVAVHVADIQAEAVEQAAEALRGAGGRVEASTVDVRDPEAMQALWERTAQALGTPDLWVNNAGVAVAGNVGDAPLDDWRWVMDVNLFGVVHGCHVAAPRMREAGRGVILNVASAAGLIATPGMGPYNVAKSGVVALTETMYGELVPHGVGVTVLCPTFFETNLMDSARTTDPRLERVARKLMARSRIQAADVARTALDDALAGRLYSVPMADGRWMWRLKRALPQSFQRLFTQRVVARGQG